MTEQEQASPDLDAARPKPVADTRMLLALAGFTLFGLGGVGAWLIVGVQDRSMLQVVIGDRSVLFHAALGVGSGALIGWAAWVLIAQPFMRPVRHKYTNLIGPLLSLIHI